MTTLVATADAATGTVRLDLEQTFARDTFSRTVAAGGWGSPDVGPAYTVHNTAAQYSVSGGLGRIAVNAIGSDFAATLDTGQADHENLIQLVTTTTPTGGIIRLGSVVRFVDTSNHFRVAAAVAVGTGIITLEIAARVSGSLVSLASVVTTLTNGSGLFLRTRACGNNVYAKLWFSSTSEPTAWTLTASYPGLTSGTRAGVFARRETGNLTPTTFLFDDSWYGTADGKPSGTAPPLRIFRVTPDGVRTELRGSPFNTFPGSTTSSVAFATLYDNEAPFDTDVFYEMTSVCSTTAVVTSNTISLSSGGNGWIRDPANPSNNIVLTEDGPAYNECNDVQEITFLGWDPRVFVNASGIFPIIGSERPNTVSMRRKRYESQFFFATKTLDDMDMMENTFMPGTILLVSLPTVYGFGRENYGQDFITVMDLEQVNANTNDYRSPHRLWTVPFQLSYAPPDLNEGLTGSNGIGGGGATYADMTAAPLGASYATTTASGETYLQLAQGVGY